MLLILNLNTYEILTIRWNILPTLEILRYFYIFVKYITHFLIFIVMYLGLFSKSNTSIYEFKKYLDVRNNKSTVSNITIKHCLPLSQDERIKVVLLEPHCKKQNTPIKLSPNIDVVLSSLNQLEWNVKLQPNEYEKIVLKFQIEFPYGMFLSGFD